MIRSTHSLLVFFIALGAASSQAKLRIVTTTQDPAAIARAIGGDRVEVKALAKGFQDPHFLDAKPTFMLDMNRADLLICIGLDLEVGYLPALIAGAHNDKLNSDKPGYLDLSRFITPLEAAPGADRSMGDIHPAGNPHYWLDPENGRLMARAISARLTQLDPEGKEAYGANLAAFEKALTQKVAAWTQALARFAGKPIITYHRSWTYFAKRFQLDVIGFVEPKPGIQPTPQHTMETIRLAQARNVQLQLMENFYDDRSPRLLESKSPAKLAMVPNSVGGVETAKTYFDLFDTIVATILKVSGG